MSPKLQVKLLRVLQEHELPRVGGDKVIPIDIRVITATHVDLVKAIEEGKFREDLYYRLNVIPVTVPSLRERAGDIPLLIEYFLKRLRETKKSTVTSISPDALKLMISYDWPGNVRELENLMERMVILAENNTLTVDDLPLKIQKIIPHSININDQKNINIKAHEKDKGADKVKAEDLSHLKEFLEPIREDKFQNYKENDKDLTELKDNDGKRGARNTEKNDKEVSSQEESDLIKNTENINLNNINASIFTKESSLNSYIPYSDNENIIQDTLNKTYTPDKTETMDKTDTIDDTATLKDTSLTNNTESNDNTFPEKNTDIDNNDKQNNLNNFSDSDTESENEDTEDKVIIKLPDENQILENHAISDNIWALIEPIQNFPKDGINMNNLLKDYETLLIEAALEYAGGFRITAAKLLGINRTTLQEKLKKK
jgi:DNA-binding NtrC family response regulator